MDPSPAERPAKPHSDRVPRPQKGTGGGEPEDPAARLLLGFARLARAGGWGEDVPKGLEELLGSGALGRRHLGVLAVVALGGSLSVSELAHKEGIALSTASLLVTQLADAGLVERREDPGDRRRTVVSIAPTHRGESEAVLDAKLAPLRRALERVGPQRAQALVEGLEVVVEEVARAARARRGPRRAPGGAR